LPNIKAFSMGQSHTLFLDFEGKIRALGSFQHDESFWIQDPKNKLFIMLQDDRKFNGICAGGNNSSFVWL
jgi:hypothetical protein